MHESSGRASWDSAKCHKASKVHIAVDTLGHLLALKVTSAYPWNRTQVTAVIEQARQVIGHTVELAYVDQSYTGPATAKATENTPSRWKWSSTS